MPGKIHLWIALVTIGLALGVAGSAAADNGPHQGDFTPTTDACAGCHRAHRAETETLLTAASEQDLCFSCHGSGATGAATNVEDGVYESAPFPENGLRGGGFVNALMDPKITGTPTLAPVTSRHRVGEPGQTIWGLGGSGPGHTTSSPRATLQCSTCHNVHGFSNADYYRLLRTDLPCLGCHDVHGRSTLQGAKTPDDAVHVQAAQTTLGVPDENPKQYTIDYFSSGNRAGYRNDGYLAGKGISSWCAQCHTRYLAPDATDSGDSIFKHRHIAGDNGPECLTCHVAHGTAAQMSTYSGAVEWPDDAPGGGNTDSRLLAVDSRGVCFQCHAAP